MKTLFLITLPYVLVIGAVLLINSISGYVHCNSYKNLTGRDVKYSLISGCFIKFNGGYIPRSEFEKRNIANGDISNNLGK